RFCLGLGWLMNVSVVQSIKLVTTLPSLANSKIDQWNTNADLVDIQWEPHHHSCMLRWWRKAWLPQRTTLEGYITKNILNWSKIYLMKRPYPSLLVGLLFVFLPSLVVFILLDVTWITLVGGSIYKTVLGNFLRSTPQIVPGLLAWVCIVGSVYLFALPNTRTQRRQFGRYGTRICE
ncbi:hypothetical protein VaNZ11_015698, partial [Volvox africanus]